jgi:hypothetical protein
LARLPTETVARSGALNRRALLIVAAVLFAPVLMAVIIHRYGVNVPYWDEWDQLSVVSRAYDHTLTAGLLWEQQNEHRPVVSKLISIVIARTTKLNLVVEMYVGFGFQLLSLILIWRMLAAGLKDRARVLIGPLTIAASLMMFWAVAHEDWIWGLASVQYFLSVLWAVLGVWALARWPGRWPSVSILSVATVLGIFTTGCGFALIGVGVLGIVGYGIAQKRIPWLQLVAFVLVSVACTALYLRGYSSPGYSATSLGRLHPIEMITYLVTYVGSPFWIRTAGYKTALLFGLIGIVSLAAAASYITGQAKNWIPAVAPWILLAGYTIINGANTAFARIDHGVEQATASRYRPVAALFWISLTAILSMIAYNIKGRFSRRVMAVVTAGAIIIFMTGYAMLYYRGLGALQRHSEFVASGLPYIMNYDSTPDEKLQMYHPTGSTVRELSRKLDHYHLGPFADSANEPGRGQ